MELLMEGGKDRLPDAVVMASRGFKLGTATGFRTHPLGDDFAEA